MSIAHCEVIHDVLVEVDAPIHVDGEMVTRRWLSPGIHHIDADFAKEQEAKGYLLINSIDGQTAYRTACCADH